MSWPQQVKIATGKLDPKTRKKGCPVSCSAQLTHSQRTKRNLQCYYNLNKRVLGLFHNSQRHRRGKHHVVQTMHEIYSSKDQKAILIETATKSVAVDRGIIREERPAKAKVLREKGKKKFRNAKRDENFTDVYS